MTSPAEPRLDRLRAQAERAIAEGRTKASVTPLLEQIVDLAPEGSAAELFAHRHLAEYRIEEHPWRALLSLRRLVRAGAADDAVFALEGLAHALLGNHLSAVAAYRRAVRIEPKNPWYRHNLGHLLDVALDRPKDAVRHLEAADAASGGDPEIAASLAHCLARLGQRARAEAIAARAAAAVPDSVDHVDLLAWIRGGAGTASGAPEAEGPAGVDAAPAAGEPRPAVADPVTDILLPAMRAGGFSPAQIDRAQQLYARYRAGAGDRVQRSRGPKPSVVAAALEYATARLENVRGVTRASVARRYGVTPRAVADRVDALAGALALTIP